jgi:hypothetical protein
MERAGCAGAIEAVERGFYNDPTPFSCRKSRN